MKKLSLILLSLFFLIACSGKEKEVPQVQELVSVALAYKPRSFDPSLQTDSATMAVTKQIYSNLFILGAQGELIPELAESYEIQDNNTVVIRLKQGILFHDGSELKAEDVVASLKRALDSPVTHVLVGPMESVESLSDYEVKIKSSAAPSILLHNFTHGAIAITKLVPENAEKINLVGTGPFKIKAWGNGEKVELEAFDSYFVKKPSFSFLNFVTIPENSNRVIALETGEIDLAYDIVPSDIKLLEEKKGLSYISGLSVGTDFLSFNTEKMKDADIRKALALAIDRKGINEAVFDGKQKIANSILAPNIFGYHEPKETWEQNIEKAKEILASKGYHAENPLKLKLYIYEEPSRRQISEIIQANLKEVNIDVEIISLEVSSFLQFTAQGEHDFLLGLWYVSSGDADYGYYPLLHSSSKGAAGNRAFYDNPKMDALLDHARTSSEEAQRQEDYAKVQELVEEELPIFPLFYKNYFIGTRAHISNLGFDPRGSHILYDLKFENK